MREPGWAVVVPVKRLAEAKSRLRVGTATAGHQRLVLAMAQDTVQAVLAGPMVAQVLVITDDPEAAAALSALGATVVPHAPAAGLNAAIRHGASLVATATRSPVAALAADLPALRPLELAGALAVMSGSQKRGFVRDAGGAGTTLLAAPAGVALRPCFGVDSATRHLSSGARELLGDWPSLRHDVDTPADLRAAAGLGLGPHTAAACAQRVP